MLKWLKKFWQSAFKFSNCIYNVVIVKWSMIFQNNCKMIDNILEQRAMVNWWCNTFYLSLYQIIWNFVQYINYTQNSHNDIVPAPTQYWSLHNKKILFLSFFIVKVINKRIFRIKSKQLNEQNQDRPNHTKPNKL